MTENRALYSRIGYVEYDHRIVDGYPRVLFSEEAQVTLSGRGDRQDLVVVYALE